MKMNRKPLPDLMKGLAVVLMVQVHILELFARQEVYDSTLGRISLFLGGPFAAPVFLAVMGYFLAASQRPTGSMAWRGVKLLGLGLALNIGLNLHLLIKIMTGAITEDPWKYIFGADILFVAGLSIIIISFLKKILKENILPYAILMLIIPVLVLFIPESGDQRGFISYLTSFFWMKTSWSYFPLIPWLSYALFGFCCSLAERKYPGILGAFVRKRAIFLPSMVVLLAATSVYPFNIITHLPSYYHHGVLVFLWISVFIVVLGSVLDMIGKEWGNTSLFRYLRWLGVNVTEFYVVQWLVIGNIGTALYKTQFPLGCLLWFVIIQAVSSIIVLAWQRVKRLIRPS